MLWKRRVALAFTVAVLFGAGLIVALGGDDGEVRTSNDPKTRLYVRTVPPGAEIKLDGELRGASNRLFVVPPGVRRMTIEVELDGYGKQRQVVGIEGGRIKRVEFKFDERPEVTGPGTPQSALSVPTGVAAMARDADFGHVIERVVNDDQVGNDWLIDLDTGKLYTPPRELDPEKNRKADPKKLAAWARQRGIDATGVKASEGILAGVELFVTFVGEASWEGVTPQQVREALDCAAHQTGAVPPIGGEDVPGDTLYAFRTREGGMGVLQIVEVTDDPMGLKIRYKMVKSAEAENEKTAWGPAVEGVQIRLWAEKKTWRVDEEVILKLDARNQGKRDLVIDHGGYGCVDFWVDHFKYSPDQHTMYLCAPAPFGPGRHHEGQSIGLGRYPGLDPAPGKHTIHIVLTAHQNNIRKPGQADGPLWADPYGRWVLKENYQPPVIVSSNPIEIEIVPADPAAVPITSSEISGTPTDGVQQDGPAVSPDEQAVRAAIRQFIEAVAEGNETATARLIEGRLADKVSQCQVDDMIEFIEPVLQLDKIDQVFLTGDRALVVTEAARLKDPKYGVVCAVYLLVRQEGRWTIRDMDLEDEKGLRRKIEQFRDSDSATSVDNDNRLIESRVLRQEFVRLLADAVAARKQAGGNVLEVWDKPESVLAIKKMLWREFPELLQLTPDQEKLLAAGKADDADAAKRFKDMIKTLEDLEAESKSTFVLPWLNKYLLEQFQAGKLRGARLELAWRLLYAQIVHIKKTLSDDAPADVETDGAPAKAARLDFRIAPTQAADGPGTLKPEEVERYVKEFQDRSKSPQRPVAWFECGEDVGERLITAKDDDGRQFVLLSTDPDETMLAVEQRRKPWGLVRVMLEKDHEGHPAVGVEFDAEGARRFAELTSNHLRQPLAMLVGGKVVYAPTIQTTISKRAFIMGRFSEQDVERMVKSLIKGMVSRP